MCKCQALYVSKSVRAGLEQTLIIIVFFFLTATSHIDDGKLLLLSDSRYRLCDLGGFKLIYLVLPSTIYINQIHTYRREYLYSCVAYYSLDIRIILENLSLNVSADRRNIRDDIAIRGDFKVALTDCIRNTLRCYSELSRR